MERENYQAALDEIENAVTAIRDFYHQHDEEAATESEELDILEDLRKKVDRKRPRSEKETLRQELDRAIAQEEYERAAELRDALNSQLIE